MSRTLKFEFTGLEELNEALKKAENSYPEAVKRYMRMAGNAFKKDVIAKTDALTKKGSGKLAAGYKSELVTTYFADKAVEAQISGGNKKAHHFHLVENGHEGWVYRNGKFYYIGFVPGKHMMKKTTDEWDSSQKLIPYAVKAINYALRKGGLD